MAVTVTTEACFHPGHVPHVCVFSLVLGPQTLTLQGSCGCRAFLLTGSRGSPFQAGLLLSVSPRPGSEAVPALLFPCNVLAFVLKSQKAGPPLPKRSQAEAKRSQRQVLFCPGAAPFRDRPSRGERLLTGRLGRSPCTNSGSLLSSVAPSPSPPPGLAQHGEREEGSQRLAVRGGGLRGAGVRGSAALHGP